VLIYGLSYIFSLYVLIYNGSRVKKWVNLIQFIL